MIIDQKLLLTEYSSYREKYYQIKKLENTES
ncbi:hypothetical protein VTH8203_01246 [Vibrio thalassae]|uniref:Uncharacterized protein n=1 Tax=Vibrio thalassae TaxID=1243014 RepID=A0A240EGI4_9VIBR|nr:hypothetical protein VTH8203_01246 [Vibrio thalassae]